jgi:site-specific recombinase XerD
MAATTHLTVVAPDNEKFTVQSAPGRLPRRKANAEYRSREHLTECEVERLIETVKSNRWGHRDATMVLLACRHGLRAAELVNACGFKLANDGIDTRTIQAYLGHKSIQHTVRYTELAPTRFKSLFRD